MGISAPSFLKRSFGAEKTGVKIFSYFEITCVNQGHVLNQATKIKKSSKKRFAILELCVISMTHLISILIGFHECQNAISFNEITKLAV